MKALAPIVHAAAELGHLAIAIPVFNEAEVIGETLHQVSAALAGVIGLTQVDLVVVDDASNDGSAEVAAQAWQALVAGPLPITLHTLRLACNQGHQRAILAGLRYLETLPWAVCLVADADGQDDPEAIAGLYAAINSGHDAVFARRTKRRESWLWVLGYRFYQLAFRLLLGQGLPLGNFCMLRRSVVARLCREGDLTHLAATVAGYPVRHTQIGVARLARSAGVTKMRPWRLVDYGAAAMTASVQAWMTLFTRLTVFAAAASTLCVLVVVGIKLFTDLAISGWASTICLVSIGISLQSMGFMSITAFMRRLLNLIAPVYVATDVRVVGPMGGAQVQPLRPKGNARSVDG